MVFFSQENKAKCTCVPLNSEIPNEFPFLFEKKKKMLKLHDNLKYICTPFST